MHFPLQVSIFDNIPLLEEVSQGHITRKNIYEQLERQLKRPVVSYFTSFRYPVMIEDEEADMLEGVLQKMDLSRGLALIINSPGGDGLSRERIINICRNYSETDEYWSIVPGKDLYWIQQNIYEC